ncbi:hypothetical protein ACOMHN_002491 [Nucella lapillus]
MVPDNTTWTNDVMAMVVTSWCLATQRGQMMSWQWSSRHGAWQLNVDNDSHGNGRHVMVPRNTTWTNDVMEMVVTSWCLATQRGQTLNRRGKG